MQAVRSTATAGRSDSVRGRSQGSQRLAGASQGWWRPGEWSRPAPETGPTHRVALEAPAWGLDTGSAPTGSRSTSRNRPARLAQTIAALRERNVRNVDFGLTPSASAVGDEVRGWHDAAAARR